MLASQVSDLIDRELGVVLIDETDLASEELGVSNPHSRAKIIRQVSPSALPPLPIRDCSLAGWCRHSASCMTQPA